MLFKKDFAKKILELSITSKKKSRFLFCTICTLSNWKFASAGEGQTTPG